MKSKTPQFDALLDEHLEQLVPHTRTCVWKGEHPHCEGEFEIQSEDIEFLKMLRVPAPNFCPTCRRMRRYVHIGQLKLFKRSCDAPGHTESMISILPQECPFPVFDYKYIASDEFDPFGYGQEYQENKSPLEQFREMNKIFPTPSFFKRSSSSVNSDYSNGGRNLKNGYFVMSAFDSEDIWYSHAIRNCKKVMDSRLLDDSEYVYRGILSQNMYNSSFVYFSKDSIDSMFLFDCKNCVSCFGCVNLRNQKYCVWNKQLTKEEYEKFIDSIYPISVSTLKEFQEKFWQLVKSLPMNASRNIAVENVQGIFLRNSRNLYDVNNSNESENIRYADGCFGHHDSMDVLYSGGSSSRFYSVINTGSKSNNIKFSMFTGECADSEFLVSCKNVQNCFMCCGINDVSYCIFNKKYEKEEYFLLVDTIKTEMLQRGEYGDGLPMSFSAQSYNFSLSQINFPLTEEEIIKLGGYIAQEPDTNAAGIKLLSVPELPQIIDDVSDEIVNQAIQCDTTGRPFRIIQTELDLYRKMKLPLPTVHPTVRMQEALLLSLDGKKYETTCAKCKKHIFSAFNPEDNFILYCEKCYQQEVY